MNVYDIVVLDSKGKPIPGENGKLPTRTMATTLDPVEAAQEYARLASKGYQPAGEFTIKLRNPADGVPEWDVPEVQPDGSVKMVRKRVTDIAPKTEAANG